jgi:hypothetical protein
MKRGIATSSSRAVSPGIRMTGISGYLLKGIDPGDFLVAVLANDLRAAVQRADPINLHALTAHVDFLCTSAPAGAWGSYAHVQGWVERVKAAHVE